MTSASHSQAHLEQLGRRDFFGRMSSGVPAIALASLLARDEVALGKESHEAVSNHEDLSERSPHFPGKAKAVIQLFMNGGPSQMDLFDPKPELDRLHGKPGPARIKADLSSPHNARGLLRSPFKFAKHGESGQDISDVLPHLHKHADDIAIIRSMKAKHFNHEPALYLIHSGKTQPGLPTIGAWSVYALGTVNQNLPAYVVLDDPNGLPVNGTQSWQPGYLPPIFQGTRLRATGTPILNLRPSKEIPQGVVETERALLRKFDRRHLNQRPLEKELSARMASYELAARMQLSATDALDLSQESEKTREEYGLNAKDDMASYGRRCLMARRLVERGVRYVQIFIEGQIWDSHSTIEKGLRRAARKTDQPVSALLTDLKRRGLWDDVLVVWNGEFGRLPVAELAKGADISMAGRDHGPSAFSLWMAGAGIKGGTVYGATDEIGHRSVENVVSVHDFHATVLHLLGLNHRDVFYTQPTQRRDRLTDEFPTRVVKEILV